MSWPICILGAYLIGSIPFGVLIARSKGVNIRAHGSRNIGATNVGRVLGKRFGVLCFVLDFLKGVGPVLAAGIINEVSGRRADALTTQQMWLWMAVAGATVLGHMYSIYLRFGGGKGVATGFGAIVGMYSLLTWPALMVIVVWYLTLRITKYVSLSSMIAVLSLPVSYAFSVISPRAMDQPLSQTVSEMLHAYPPFVGTLLIAVLVIWKHRANIGRLRRGEEPKVTGKARRGGIVEQPTPRSGLGT